MRTFDKKDATSFDSSLTERRLKEHAVLASLLKKTEDRETEFEELENHLRYLVASAKHFHDWTIIVGLAEGRVDFIDSLSVPAKYKEANVTPVSQYGGFIETVDVPAWVSGYTNVLLATKWACSNYSKDQMEYIAKGTWFDEFRGRLMDAKEGKAIMSVSMVMSIKLLSDAIRAFEHDIQSILPNVTSTPSFFLLLASYETLHSAGYRPCHIRGGEDSGATYLDLAQMFLERFPEKTHPEVHEYLSWFSFRGAEANYRSTLLSRIDYEGDMERLFSRGFVRQKAINELMGKIRKKTVDIEKSGP